MSSLEKYRLVSNTKADFDNIHVPSVCRGWTKKVCELKISQKGKPKHYIADALHMFHQGSQTIIIRAMGRAMSKAITIAEVLKRKLTVYQVTHLSTINVVDIYEPLEEGLDKVESVRYVSCIEIVLSLDTEEIDIHDIGYQPPQYPGYEDNILSKDFESKISMKSP